MASTICIKMLDKTVEVDLSENILTQSTIKCLFLMQLLGCGTKLMEEKKDASEFILILVFIIL